MKTNMRQLQKIGLIIFLVSLVLLAGCGKDKSKLQYEYPSETIAAQTYPDVSFVVISDLHVYNQELGTTGDAFEETMRSDRKLLLDSVDLLDYAINEITVSKPSFVLISGDLTKDGELVNHQLMAGKLKAFTDAGIPVYVVPGNHDVNNPGAVSYSENGTAPVSSINADDFAQIYGEFGYNEAFLRDDDSLSYVVEPVDGLWLLALDACRYRENKPGYEEIVSGKISQQTADWIAMVLKTAAGENKAVMAMMHHGVVEHWNGQAKLHPDYLINDYANFGKFLASWNVRLAFSGHYHAQDITRGSFGDQFIYDVETGSLVTAPCPIRYAEIKDNAIEFRSETIADKIHPDTDFADNGRAFVKKTVMLEAIKTLKQYNVSDKDADYIADAVGDAFDAHYAGDENPALRPAFDKKKLGAWGKFVYGQQKYVLDGLWVDLPPEDSNVRVEL